MRRRRDTNQNVLKSLSDLPTDVPSLSGELFYTIDGSPEMYVIGSDGNPNLLVDASGQSSGFGFIDYADTGNKVTMPANTWVDIPNDGQGTTGNDSYKPDNVNDLLDTSSGYIDVSELNLGDDILIRNSYTVIPKVNDSKLEIRYVLGSGASQYVLQAEVATLDRGAGVPYTYSLRTDYIYVGNNNTRQNPIRPQLRLEFGGSLVNSGTVIKAATK